MVLNVNTHKTNVITGKECITLYGPGVLHDTMRGVPVALGPLSFYQVNTEGANRLYGVAADFAAPGPEDTLLDLYCGAGTIGLSMAEHCGRLIGVEIVPEAVESARRNAAAMGVEHAEFFCADAGTAAQKLAADGLLPNIVVLDPPRKGCDEPTLKAVLAMAPPAHRDGELQSCHRRAGILNIFLNTDMLYRPYSQWICSRAQSMWNARRFSAAKNSESQQNGGSASAPPCQMKRYQTSLPDVFWI